MNRNTRESLALRAKHKAKSLAVKLGTAATVAMVSVPALAQTAPDTSAIEGEFDVYKAAVVGLVIAFAVVLWAIKAAGLLKPR